MVLSAGDQAVDFTLWDLDGREWTLSSLLAARPVVLLWGMYTCPAFQVSYISPEIPSSTVQVEELTRDAAFLVGPGGERQVPSVQPDFRVRPD